VPAYLSSVTAPIGWASLGGGTTGGGNATPVLVTTLADFKTAAAGTTARVIYVQGNFAQDSITIGSNKTIIGCSSGATLNGSIIIKNATNVILRNLSIKGYNCAPPDVDITTGGQCQNGLDAFGIDGSQRVWVDHCNLSDGSDGTLDINHGADFITISYSKIFYSTKRTDPNDTGDAGHRYASLIGGSDTNDAQDSTHLNVTFHHDWWADNVVERQPRVRFGKVHLFNNLWTSTGNNYCIGVGKAANILNEYNAFINVKTPINTTSYVVNGTPSYAKSQFNLYSGTSGNPVQDLNAAGVFTPGYSYTPQAATEVQADVQANAGPH